MKTFNFSEFKNDKKTLLYIPFIIFFLILVFVPLIYLVVSAFITPAGASPDYDMDFILHDKSFWTILLRSFGIGFATSIISLAIGLPYVYLLTTFKNKYVKFILISFIVSPLLLFTLVKILALRSFFSVIFDAPIDNSAFLIAGLVYLNLPFMIIPLYIVFNNMPSNLLQASYDLGYSKTQSFIRVVIPYGLKAIISGVTVTFLLSIMSIALSDKLLENAEGNKLLGNLIFELTNPGNLFDMQKASSVIVITFSLVSVVYLSLNAIPFIYRKVKGGTNE